MKKNQLAKIQNVISGERGGYTFSDGEIIGLENHGYFAFKFKVENSDEAEEEIKNYKYIIRDVEKGGNLPSIKRYFAAAAENIQYNICCDVSIKELREYIKENVPTDVGKGAYRHKQYIRKIFNYAYDAGYMVDLLVCMGLKPTEKATLYFHKSNAKAIYVVGENASIGIIMPVWVKGV